MVAVRGESRFPTSIVAVSLDAALFEPAELALGAMAVFVVLFMLTSIFPFSRCD